MSTGIANTLVVMGYAMARTHSSQEDLMRYDSYAASHSAHLSQAESSGSSGASLMEQAQACRFVGRFSSAVAPFVHHVGKNALHELLKDFKEAEPLHFI